MRTRLSDGTPVMLRAIEASDKRALERGIARIQASIESDNLPALALMRTIAARLTYTDDSLRVREVVADIAAAR